MEEAALTLDAKNEEINHLKAQTAKMLKGDISVVDINESTSSDDDSDANLSYEPERAVTQEEEIALQNTDSDKSTTKDNQSGYGNFIDNENHAKAETVQLCDSGDESSKEYEFKDDDVENNSTIHNFDSQDNESNNKTDDVDPTLNLEGYFSDSSKSEDSDPNSPPRVQRKTINGEDIPFKSPFCKGVDEKDDYSVRTEKTARLQTKKTKISLISPDGVNPAGKKRSSPRLSNKTPDSTGERVGLGL